MLGIHLERGGNGPIGRTLGTPSSTLNTLQRPGIPSDKIASAQSWPYGLKWRGSTECQLGLDLQHD